MQQLLPRLFARPLLFAHRGGLSRHPENSMAAFTEALEGGATALETDLWATADDVVVLDHDGVSTSGLRRRPLRKVQWEQVSVRLTSLEQLLTSIPATVDISVDVKDDEVFPLLPHVFARVARDPAQVWICHPMLDVLSTWNEKFIGPRYVHSTKLESIQSSPERHAQRLRSVGIAACNMHWRSWSGGLVTLYHRFGIACFAWGLEHETDMRNVIRMGMDGLYADDIRALHDAYRASMA
jgi:glycerophosphoryl diester phosphodiesterase